MVIPGVGIICCAHDRHPILCYLLLWLFRRPDFDMGRLGCAMAVYGRITPNDMPSSGFTCWLCLKLSMFFLLLHTLISLIRKNVISQSNCFGLWIAFIFEGCLCSWAALAPAKYEHAIQYVANVLTMMKKHKNNGMDEIDLVTPTQ